MSIRLAMAFLLVASVAFPEQTDVENFGKCMVATNKDEFTDEVESHFLACGEDDFAVGVNCYEGDTTLSHIVIFSVTGVFLVDKSRVTIKYRFDKDDPFVGEGIALSNHGWLTGRVRFDEMLEGIATADSFVFQLDDETRRLSLSSADGTAVVAELRSRCPDQSSQ